MTTEIKQIISNGSAQHEVPTAPALATTGRIVPITSSELLHFGAFNSVKLTAAGTLTVATPKAGQALMVTDVVIGSSKTAASNVQLRFTDGPNTVRIIEIDSINSALAWSFSPRAPFRGWVDARIDLITTGNVTVVATVGYIKLESGIPFAEWDALR